MARGAARALEAAFLAAALCVLAAGAFAQLPGLPAGSGGGPVEVEAEQGIEWQREAKAYIARGNARARQGEVEIRADRLIAYYREVDGGNRIWRFDAVGAVRIASPGQTATGDSAVYDVDQGVLVLRGENLALNTETERITARDSLEYWEKRKLAVARGNVLLVRDDKRIRADVVTGHFAADAQGKTRLVRVDLFDNVHVSTRCEIVVAKRGVYDIPSSIAKLSGAVKITRGASQLNGEYAEVNLRTGISRLQGSGGARGYFSSEDLAGGNSRCTEPAPGG